MVTSRAELVLWRTQRRDPKCSERKKGKEGKGRKKEKRRKRGKGKKREKGKNIAENRGKKFAHFTLIFFKKIRNKKFEEILFKSIQKSH